MNKVSDDEVGLLDFFEILWKGKNIIFSFIFFILILAFIFISISEPVYESKIIYESDSVPPYYDNSIRPSRDFQKLFYTQSVFDVWKDNNKASLLVFEDFNPTQVIDGIVFSKHEDKLTAIHEKDQEIGSYILIRSDQFTLLDDLFKYANHVNNALTLEYILRSKDEINIMYKRFNEPSATTDTVIRDLLSVDRYIVEADKGDKVLTINRPTAPVMVSPKINLILTISFVLGTTLAIIYIFIIDAIRARKHQKAKTRENS